VKVFFHLHPLADAEYMESFVQFLPLVVAPFLPGSLEDDFRRFEKLLL